MKLGSTQNVRILIKFVTDDGSNIYDEGKFVQIWKSTFKNLYTNPNVDFDLHSIIKLFYIDKSRKVSQYINYLYQIMSKTKLFEGRKVISN